MSKVILTAKVVMVVALLAVGLEVLSPTAEAAEGSVAKIYRNGLRGTVWVGTKGGSGTGWLVNRDSRLVITNHHVVGPNKTVVVVFPRYGRRGQVVAERSAYQKGPFLRGRVLRVDVSRDLALVQVDGALPRGATALKLAAAEPSPGDRLHSIGNPGRSRALWVYTGGAVRSVFTDKWKNQLAQGGVVERSGRIVEMQSPVNPGDSGGPVLNGDGEVVGVVHGVDRNASLLNRAISVYEVRAFLRSRSAVRSNRSAGRQ